MNPEHEQRLWSREDARVLHVFCLQLVWEYKEHTSFRSVWSICLPLTTCASTLEFRKNITSDYRALKMNFQITASRKQLASVHLSSTGYTGDYLIICRRWVIRRETDSPAHTGSHQVCRRKTRRGRVQPTPLQRRGNNLDVPPEDRSHWALRKPWRHLICHLSSSLQTFSRARLESTPPPSPSLPLSPAHGRTDVWWMRGACTQASVSQQSMTPFTPPTSAVSSVWPPPRRRPHPHPQHFYEPKADRPPPPPRL